MRSLQALIMLPVMFDPIKSFRDADGERSLARSALSQVFRTSLSSAYNLPEGGVVLQSGLNSGWTALRAQGATVVWTSSYAADLRSNTWYRHQYVEEGRRKMAAT